jgi:hypothetical protein
MVRTSKTRGRNLFALDQASIESTLAEANGHLLKERDDLLHAFERLPDSLDTLAQIETTQTFARKLEGLLAESKQARLSDGKPFSEATKVVKDFFARIEGPLKAVLQEIIDRVTNAALRQRRLDDGTARLDLENTSDEEPPSDHQPLSPAIRGRDGAAVIAIADASPTQISMEWIVADFDRHVLDLEELRPFLTDSALTVACRKHLEANGPHRLKGVRYKQVALV